MALGLCVYGRFMRIWDLGHSLFLLGILVFFVMKFNVYFLDLSSSGGMRRIRRLQLIA